MASKDIDFLSMMNQISDEMVSADDKHLFVLDFVKLLDKFALPAQRSTVKRFLMASLKQFTKLKSRKVHFEVFPLWLLLVDYSETMTMKEILDRVDYLYEDYFPYYRAYINYLLATKQRDAAMKMLQRCKVRCGMTDKQLEEEFPSLKEKKTTFATAESTIMIMDSMEHTMLSNAASPPVVKPAVVLKPAIKTTKSAGGDLVTTSRSVNILPSVPEVMDSSCANESGSFASSPVCDKPKYPVTPRAARYNMSESTEDKTPVKSKVVESDSSMSSEVAKTETPLKDSVRIVEKKVEVSPVREVSFKAHPVSEKTSYLPTNAGSSSLISETPNAEKVAEKKIEISPVHEIGLTVSPVSEKPVYLPMNVEVVEQKEQVEVSPVCEAMSKVSFNVSPPCEKAAEDNLSNHVGISSLAPHVYETVPQENFKIAEQKVEISPDREVDFKFSLVSEKASKDDLPLNSGVPSLISETKIDMKNDSFANDSLAFAVSPVDKKPEYPTPMKTLTPANEKTVLQEDFKIAEQKVEISPMNESVSNKSEVSLKFSPVSEKIEKDGLPMNFETSEGEKIEKVEISPVHEVSFNFSPVKPKPVNTDSPMNFVNVEAKIDTKNASFANDSLADSFVLSPAYKSPAYKKSKYPTPMKTLTPANEETAPQEEFKVAEQKVEFSPMREAMSESLANKSEVSFMFSPIADKAAKGDADLSFGIPSLVSEIVEAEIPIEAEKINKFSKE